MARSLLGSFVTGARQLLAVQLFVSIGAVALAGWTLGITNDLIRERNRLRDRVIQLEETLASRGITVPATPAIVDVAAPPGESAYPPSAALTEPSLVGLVPGAETQHPFNPGQVLGDLFAPPPPLRIVVLHVRAEADADIAGHIARALGQDRPQGRQVRIVVNVMAPRDPRPSGYAYFDGRQSPGAAALAAQFNDIARGINAAPWSAQLRGVALPANAEFSADRLDILLPPLPTQDERIDPVTGMRILE